MKLFTFLATSAAILTTPASSIPTPSPCPSNYPHECASPGGYLAPAALTQQKAHLIEQPRWQGPVRCVRSKLKATVFGEPILRVSFRFNSELIRTLKANKGQTRFAIKIKRRGDLTALITFAGGQGQLLNFTDCPPPKHPRKTIPRFTG